MYYRSGNSIKNLICLLFKLDKEYFCLHKQKLPMYWCDFTNFFSVNKFLFQAKLNQNRLRLLFEIEVRRVKFEFVYVEKIRKIAPILLVETKIHEFFVKFKK